MIHQPPMLHRCALSALLVVLLAGCGSTKPPAPTMDEPRTAVRQAEQAGARDYAPLELRNAQKKLEEAKTAAEQGNTRKARLLVEKAQIDAQLAQVKALSAKSQEAVDELRESIQTLRDEIQRSESRQ